MADIYLDTLAYYKTESDTIAATERVRVDSELNSKSDKSDEGSPSGIATLDGSGDINREQMPYADPTESMDVTNVTEAMTPERTHYVIGQTTIPVAQKGVVNGICPLDASGKVDASYLNPAGHIRTEVVTTLAERDALIDINESDSCYVTDDPSDTGGDVNGQYLAEIDNPSVNDWTLLPNNSLVSSVNTQVGVVNITSISESASNKVDISALDLRLTQNESDVGVNAADILTAEGRLDSIETLNGNQGTAISTNGDSIGIISNLTPVANTNLVAAVNDVDARLVTQETTFGLSQFYDATVTAFTVPDTFSALPDIEVVVSSAPAGTYMIGYSFEVDFAAVKDKPLHFYTTLNNMDSDTFSESVSTADTLGNKSRYYTKPFVHVGGDIVWGISFLDYNGGNNFTIDTGSVMVFRVA